MNYYRAFTMYIINCIIALFKITADVATTRPENNNDSNNK